MRKKNIEKTLEKNNSNIILQKSKIEKEKVNKNEAESLNIKKDEFKGMFFNKLKKNFSHFGSVIKKSIRNVGKDSKLINEKFNLIELIMLVILAFVFGIFISEAFVFQKGSASTGGVSSVLMPNTSNSSEIDKAYNTIMDKYYQDIDESKLKEAAINGMLEYLGDDYSLYFDEVEKEDFEEELNGVYYGVGLKLTKAASSYPIVTEVFADTPASESDFQVGDYLTKVEGKDIISLTLADVVANIKGVSGKKVAVTIKRGEEEIQKTITTKKIDIPSVYSEVFKKGEKKIGYLYLSIFAQNTDDQFKKELDKFESSGIDGLIIDVRNNVGGHLTTVTDILNLFFDKDEVLYQRDKKGVISKIYGQGKNKDYPVAVLVNEVSASASEILASAFKEINNSHIIGKTTFGKGTVQQTIELADGGMIKITTENWLTSNGNLIDGEGVVPTNEVELSEEYLNNPSNETDNQLQTAIDILVNK